MKPYGIHPFYDEEDNSYDGWLTNIVVRPAVIGFGSSDGSDYKTPRVWMKAEVVLGEPAPQQDIEMVDIS